MFDVHLFNPYLGKNSLALMDLPLYLSYLLTPIPRSEPAPGFFLSPI